MDSGNISEAEKEVIQPDEVVVTESEATEATPQAEATEETEFFVEEEGDQQIEPKSGMSETEQKAAFRQERAKRKKKTEELKAAGEREEALQRRIEDLERKAAPAKPNPSDYIDATEYQEAVDKHNGTKAAPAQQQQVQGITLSDDQAFHAHATSEVLRKALPDYDEAEGDFKKFIASKVENPDNAINGLIAMTHAHDVDYAKAVYAFKKFPKLQEELAAAPNDSAILSVMKKAAGKVKTRKAAKIDTKPEPELKSSGAVNVGSKEIDKARAAYQADSSIANFKKLSALKKQYK